MDEIPELTGEELQRFLQAIQEGIEALDRGEVVPHEEVVRNLEQRLGISLRRPQQTDSS